eukprot:TRINITY_DN5075_c0_g1_i1.p1 TRINITY_DN5075_c0_g1~~TRINITY_DN5075_c0_g1_i1.p1  ORF type:complete len:609 (-),score=122.91 TRINITY_DN5075_c0_g1_i1:134-1960(-)
MPTSESFLGSLKYDAKIRVLEMIHSTQKIPGDWKVMIADRYTTRILNDICSTFDLMEQGITVFERIENQRNKLARFEAIYFLKPSVEIVEALINDFSDVKAPTYGAVHLFFCSGLEESLFQKIADSTPLSNRIKTLKELNLDFFIFESKIFHLNWPTDSFLGFFHQKNLNQNAHIIAEKLFTVCSTLREYPKIRYLNGSALCHEIAILLQRKLESLTKTTTTFGEEEERGVLLLMDRRADLLTPLLHQFTYQAMALDLLPITLPTQIYKYDGKDVQLDETDDLWKDLRHQHMAKVLPTLASRFRQFCDSSSVVQNQEAFGELNIEKMAQVVKELPHFHQQKMQFSLHLHLTDSCMSLYKARQLHGLALVEQALALGTVTDCSDVSGTSLETEHRQRLELIHEAATSLHRSQVATLLQRLPLFKQLLSSPPSSSPHHSPLNNLRQVTAFSAQIWPQLFAAQSKLGQAAQKVKKNETLGEVDDWAEEYELSRYVGPVRGVLEELLTNVLPLDRFPFVANGSESGAAPTRPAAQVCGCGPGSGAGGVGLGLGILGGSPLLPAFFTPPPQPSEPSIHKKKKISRTDVRENRSSTRKERKESNLIYGWWFSPC